MAEPENNREKPSEITIDITIERELAQEDDLQEWDDDVETQPKIDVFRLINPYFPVSQIMEEDELRIIISNRPEGSATLRLIDATDSTLHEQEFDVDTIDLRLRGQLFPGTMLIQAIFGKQVVKKEVFVVEVITELIPEVHLHRGDNFYGIATQFLPGDLISLQISNTGKKSTVVKMIDSKGQARYHGRKGGSDTTFTTRLQHTKNLGEWMFSISGSLPEDEEDFNISYPFYIVDEITEVVEEASIVEISEDVIDAVPETSVPEVIEKIVYVEKEEEVIPEFLNDMDPFGQPSLIKGIGPATETVLLESGVNTTLDIALHTVDSLSSLCGKSEKYCITWIHNSQIALFGNVFDIRIEHHPILRQKAEEWKERIVELEPIPVQEEDTILQVELPEIKHTGHIHDSTSVIKGIGPVTEGRLLDLGIRNVEELSRTDPIALAEKLRTTAVKVSLWVEAAQIMMYGRLLVKLDEKTEQLTEVENEPETPIEDLHVIAEFNLNGPPSLIKGIGVATEEKLESVGVRKAREVLNIREEDISSRLGISEGRVRKWKELAWISIYGFTPDL